MATECLPLPASVCRCLPLSVSLLPAATAATVATVASIAPVVTVATVRSPFPVAMRLTPHCASTNNTANGSVVHGMRIVDKATFPMDAESLFHKTQAINQDQLDRTKHTWSTALKNQVY